MRVRQRSRTYYLKVFSGGFAMGFSIAVLAVMVARA
jgi:hypothetical protein